MSLFEKVPLAQPDPVFLTKTAFQNDKDPNKMNLGIGAYRDDKGQPWVLPSVRKAEGILATKNVDHEYLSIDGLPDFYNAARELILGDFGVREAARVASVQTLSGTGSLRVVAEFIAEHLPGRSVVWPEPTWGNHQAILKRARIAHSSYRYLDSKTLGLDFAGMVEDIGKLAPGTIVLLHACAHNPTGVDPSHEQWASILGLIQQRGLVAWFDSAYQGFASGSVERDRFAVEEAAKRGMEIFSSQSFAKNFGLYGERTGAAHIICRTADQAKAVKSQLELVIRPMYSNPPAYGARLVALVLTNPELRKMWGDDLTTMSNRIATMRNSLVKALRDSGTPGEWGHIAKQIGMFAYTGLTEAQVERLTDEWHIHLLKSGRISMAGVNSGNVDYLARAIQAVVVGKARV